MHQYNVIYKTQNDYMKSLPLIFLFIICCQWNTFGQLYFPPNNSNVWSTIEPSSLGWCQNRLDSLYRFLESNNTKAFILLKDGKIVIEKYFNGHTSSSNWYWASAGKTLTATLVGIAQQENLLKISDLTSKYLGKGWTSCTPAQEDKITIRHQLAMTSGLDDGVSDPFCTLNSCLKFKADAGTRWAYHNGPYTLLDGVMEKATGTNLNIYTAQKLKNITGMDGLYLKQDYNNVFFSTARSMARFGLLILNKGTWNGTKVLSDQQYYNEMVNTSQSINESYGYLWWLNGKNSFMIPQTQIKFQGSLNKSAPNDMFSALGKNGQFINVIPSSNMVWIRMGDNPDNALVPFLFNEDITKYINALSCTSSANDQNEPSIDKLNLYPNPVENELHISFYEVIDAPINFTIYDHLGRIKQNNTIHDHTSAIDVSYLSTGIYFLHIRGKKINKALKFLKH